MAKGTRRRSAEAKPAASAKRTSSKAVQLLEDMRNNPRGDWTIKDIERLCGGFGLTCSPPSSGSHYKVSSPFVTIGVQSVPAHRPIKPVYIRQVVSLVDAHRLAEEGQTR